MIEHPSRTRETTLRQLGMTINSEVNELFLRRKEEGLYGEDVHEAGRFGWSAEGQAAYARATRRVTEAAVYEGVIEGDILVPKGSHQSAPSSMP